MTEFTPEKIAEWRKTSSLKASVVPWLHEALDHIEKQAQEIKRLKAELTQRTEGRDIAVRLKLRAQGELDTLRARVAELEAELSKLEKREDAI